MHPGAWGGSAGNGLQGTGAEGAVQGQLQKRSAVLSRKALGDIVWRLQKRLAEVGVVLNAHRIKKLSYGTVTCPINNSSWPATETVTITG